jgi:molybdopterin-guanine dinucleotide biosynthesis protein A
MPFINLKLLNYMLSQAQGAEIVVPVSSGGVEPLFAIYFRSCLKTIKLQISRGERRLCSLFPHHQVRCLSRQEIAPLDPGGNSFFNMNTPSDYQKAKELWSII